MKIETAIAMIAAWPIAFLVAAPFNWWADRHPKVTFKDYYTRTPLQPIASP